MLKIKNLDVYYDHVQVLREVSLHVKEGELLTILGSNGAGKSTLLETIVGLCNPKKGDILLKGKSIAGKSTEYIIRQGISLVPESREIFNTLSVLDNLLIGAFHRYRKEKDKVLSEVQEILEIFPALKGRERDLAGSLSGGLQQMLAIGRGLMANPLLLLLDEPSVGLAPLVVREIMSILGELKKNGVTVVLVEQNTKHALRVADSVLVMERGRITLSGNSEEIIENPLVKEAYLGRSRIKARLAL